MFLWFEFNPLLFIVKPQDNGYGVSYLITIFNCIYEYSRLGEDAPVPRYRNIIRWNTSSISWYLAEDTRGGAESQVNASGATYCYLIIG